MLSVDRVHSMLHGSDTWQVRKENEVELQQAKVSCQMVV